MTAAAAVDRGRSKGKKGRIRRLLFRAALAYLAIVFVVHRVSLLPDAGPTSTPPSARFAANPAQGAQNAQTTSAGVLHVHTGYSNDAVGTVEELAAAAKASGLSHVIVSDHQSNEEPDSIPRPIWQDDVLLLFSQERGLDREIGRVLVEGVDTVLFLGDTTDKLRRVAARPDVLAIISHPRATSEVESWKTEHAGGAHAWEIFNLDDVLERRMTGYGTLAHAFGILGSHVVGRGEQSLLRLYARGFDEPGVPAFDSMYAREPITALGALDTHPKARWLGRLWPSYHSQMGTLVNHVVLSGPLSADPEVAATSVRESIKDGRVFISFGGTESASGFRMTLADQSGELGGIGDRLVLSPGLQLRVEVPAEGRNTLFRVYRDGQRVLEATGDGLVWPIPEHGVYRVEVYTYQGRVGPAFWNLRPWIFTNPVRVERPAGDTGASRTS